MQVLLKIWVCTTLVMLVKSIKPGYAQSNNIEQIAIKLESALNNSNTSQIGQLMSRDHYDKTINKYKKLIGRFPNAKWKIFSSGELEDGRNVLSVTVTGNSRKSKSYFKAQQKIAIRAKKNIITEQEIVKESSILQQSGKPLNITLSIPDQALTGTRYDFDVLINKPLGNSIAIGGMAILTPEQIMKQKAPEIELRPLGGGGLFKSIKAPLNPGYQHCVAFIAHEDGLISVTKLVRIIEE